MLFASVWTRGHVQKWQVFNWDWISHSCLNQFTWVKLVQKQTLPLLQHLLPHNEVEPNPCDATQCSWESTPILMGSKLKLSKSPRLHWTIPDALQELIQQLLYRIEIRAYLTYVVCVGFYTHLIASSEREVNWLRLELEWNQLSKTCHF